MEKTEGQTSLSKRNSSKLNLKIYGVYLFSASSLLCSCASSRPNLEYVLAREAIAAAKEVDAAKYAPGYFHKAEESFRLGQNLFKEQKFDESVKELRAARYNAERSETSARLLRQKAGDEEL